TYAMDRRQTDFLLKLAAGALTVAGVVVVLVGYLGVRDHDDLVLQLPYVVSGGLGGLGRLRLGAAALFPYQSRVPTAVAAARTGGRRCVPRPPRRRCGRSATPSPASCVSSAPPPKRPWAGRRGPAGGAPSTTSTTAVRATCPGRRYGARATRPWPTPPSTRPTTAPG